MEQQSQVQLLKLTGTVIDLTADIYESTREAQLYLTRGDPDLAQREWLRTQRLIRNLFTLLPQETNRDAVDQPPAAHHSSA